MVASSYEVPVVCAHPAIWRLLLDAREIEGEVGQFLVNNIVADVDNAVLEVPLHFVEVRHIREPEAAREYLLDFIIGILVLKVHLLHKRCNSLINMP